MFFAEGLNFKNNLVTKAMYVQALGNRELTTN